MIELIWANPIKIHKQIRHTKKVQFNFHEQRKRRRGLGNVIIASFTFISSKMWCLTYLVHWISEKGFQTATLQKRLLFQSSQDWTELFFLLAFGQHLQRKVVIAHVLLVDDQHGQQHVKQIAYAVWPNRTNLKNHSKNRKQIGIFRQVWI